MFQDTSFYLHEHKAHCDHVDCNNQYYNLDRRRRSFSHPNVLYVTGLASSGQLGVSTETGEAPDDEQVHTPVGISSQVFSNEPIRCISSGWYHTVVVTDSGRLYSAGAGYAHQAGHSFTTNAKTFQPVDCRLNFEGGSPHCVPLRNIAHISCGGHHTLCLSEDGRVFAFGEGREGQLGDGNRVPSSAPREVVVYDSERAVKRKFKYVAAGGYHSILIDDHNTAFSCGKNAYGQCGIPRYDRGSHYALEDEYITSPKQIDSVSPAQGSHSASIFVAASCGAWHTILLDKQGQCYGCGDSQYGQLGIVQYQRVASTSSASMAEGDDIDMEYTVFKSRYSIPERIPGMDNVKQIAAGYFHTCFLKKDGTLWTCGWSSFGQCGHTGTNGSERVPKQVMAFFNIPLWQVAAGWNHVACIDMNGQAYTFGEAKLGALGVLSPIVAAEDHVDTPKPVTALEGIPIKHVAAGRGHTVFLVGVIKRPDAIPLIDRHFLCDLVIEIIEPESSPIEVEFDQDEGMECETSIAESTA